MKQLKPLTPDRELCQKHYAAKSSSDTPAGEVDMQDAEILLLEESFREVAAVRDDAAELFYERLFANDPALRAMFASADMKDQGRKLMAALAFVVSSLRRLDAVVPALQTLAVKHVGYGVKDEHYATVGTALIETLSLFFANRFTLEHRRVWIMAYDTVANVMMAAAANSLQEREASLS